MELSLIIPHIEALIFASDKPLAISELVELVNNALGFIEDRATEDQVEAAVHAVKEKYDAEFYAFGLVESGGGWQFLTKPEFHKTIAQLNGDKFLKKLSVASKQIANPREWGSYCDTNSLTDFSAVVNDANPDASWIVLRRSSNKSANCVSNPRFIFACCD